MNNSELELKVKEIIKIENFFDMIEAALDFEKEYKQSDFYKKTKQPLLSMLKEAAGWYGIAADRIFKEAQKEINKLDISHLNDLLDKIAETFGTENAAITEQISQLQDIMAK